MINVTIGNNLKKSAMNFPKTTTLKAALEAAEMNYAGTMLTLDGSSLAPGDLNKTFADLGYDGTPGHNRAFLLAVTKADNAA